MISVTKGPNLPSSTRNFVISNKPFKQAKNTGDACCKRNKYLKSKNKQNNKQTIQRINTSIK